MFQLYFSIKFLYEKRQLYCRFVEKYTISCASSSAFADDRAQFCGFLSNFSAGSY